MKNIRFERSGRDEDGGLIYNLWIDGRLVERGLDIEQVVERINRSEFPGEAEEAEHAKDSDLP